VSAAETTVRALAEAMWPGSETWIVESRQMPIGRRKRGPVQHVVWAAFPEQAIAHASTAEGAWEAAEKVLRDALTMRVAEIDRRTAAMAEERARIVAALEVQP